MSSRIKFGKIFGGISLLWVPIGALMFTFFFVLTALTANIATQKLAEEVRAHLDRDMSENNILRISEYMAILMDQNLLSCSRITKNEEVLLNLGSSCESPISGQELILGQRSIAFSSPSGLQVQMKANLN